MKEATLLKNKSAGGYSLQLEGVCLRPRCRPLAAFFMWFIRSIFKYTVYLVFFEAFQTAISWSITFCKSLFNWGLYPNMNKTSSQTKNGAIKKA